MNSQLIQLLNHAQGISCLEIWRSFLLTSSLEIERSDLGRVKSSDVLIIPGGKGFIFNQVFGKTLRGNGKNAFAVKPVANSPFCSVYNLNLYVTLAKKMCIDLKDGFPFRATDPRGHVSESPFVGSAVGNRLKKHLSDLRIDNGETMHSFRSGCSITLSLLGVSYERVAKHVGWKSVEIIHLLFTV